MNSDAKIVLRDLGLILHVPGFMALVVAFMSYWFHEEFAALHFGATAAFSFLTGQVLYRTLRDAGETRLSHGMVTAALAWLIVPMIGAYPIWGTALALRADPLTPDTVREFQRPINAIFEAFSGFTGTGLTMALRPSELPRCILWWRSFTEWVGGVGVIVLMLSVVRLGTGAFRLYFSEGREERIAPTVTSTVRTIWWIYVLMTAAGVLLFRALGMTWWQSLNYGMTAIATGGFGVTDGNFADFGPALKLAAMAVMFAGSVSFAVHYQMLRKRRFSAFYRDPQHRTLCVLVVLGILVAILELRWFSGSWTIVDPAFQWVSALSTAGLQSADLTSWSPTGQLLLSLGMIMGGAAGSTVGGIKIARVVMLERSIRWRFQRYRMKPHQLPRYELGSEVLSEEQARERIETAAVLALLWAGVMWLAIVVLLHFVPREFTLAEVVLEVASTQGNVGLSVGITTPGLHWVAKVTMIVVMWLGRLEIAPALILLHVPYAAVLRAIEKRVRKPM